jgi:hypothetical protein
MAIQPTKAKPVQTQQPAGLDAAQRKTDDPAAGKPTDTNAIVINIMGAPASDQSVTGTPAEVEQMQQLVNNNDLTAQARRFTSTGDNAGQIGARTSVATVQPTSGSRSAR